MTLVKRGLALLVLASIAPTAALASKPGFRDGIYSSFFIHPDTGDALGMEFELHMSAKSYAYFTLCEGECMKVERVAVTNDAGAMRFTYTVPLVDGCGKHAAPMIMHFLVRPSGRSLSVENLENPGHPDRLKPIAARRALAIPPGPDVRRPGCSK